MDIDEEFGGLESLNLRISGMTTDDPTLRVTKNVVNASGAPWVGFEIGLNDGSNTFIAGRLRAIQ